MFVFFRYMVDMLVSNNVIDEGTLITLGGPPQPLSPCSIHTQQQFWKTNMGCNCKLLKIILLKSLHALLISVMQCQQSWYVWILPWQVEWNLGAKTKIWGSMPPWPLWFRHLWAYSGQWEKSTFAITMGQHRQLTIQVLHIITHT